MCIDFKLKMSMSKVKVIAAICLIFPLLLKLCQKRIILWILVIGQIQSIFLSKILFFIRYLLPSFHHQKPMVDYTLLLFPSGGTKHSQQCVFDDAFVLRVLYYNKKMPVSKWVEVTIKRSIS